MLEAVLGGGEVDQFGFGDERTDPIDLIARRDRPADGAGDLLEPIARYEPRRDRLAAGRFLVEHGQVHVAEIGEREGARDRRRRHDQDVDRLALGPEGQALVHAEAVLLVDDSEAEIAEGDVLLEQGVRADDDGDRAFRQPQQGRAALRRRGRVR